MDNNKLHYEKKYETSVEYRYKTNTRYQRFLVEKLEKLIPCENIESVCDVGCGQGLNTVFFVSDFPNAEVLGIDLSSKGIDFAISHYGDYERINFCCEDIMNYDMDSTSFDIVTAFELLEHLEHWEPVAKSMCHAAKKYIIVSAPIGKMREYEVKHGHYRNFQHGELEQFFNNNGFETVQVYYAGFPFWSPMTRDLLNLVPGDSTKVQENISILGKMASLMLYFLFRYCSTVKRGGDQFVGLFRRKL